MQSGHSTDQIIDLVFLYPREGLLDKRGYCSTKKTLAAADQKSEVETLADLMG